jgi:hypothetical protein
MTWRLGMAEVALRGATASLRVAEWALTVGDSRSRPAPQLDAAANTHSDESDELYDQDTNAAVAVPVVASQLTPVTSSINLKAAAVSAVVAVRELLLEVISTPQSTSKPIEVTFGTSVDKDSS